jgi:transglutaminase-like putative cysteine protease
MPEIQPGITRPGWGSWQDWVNIVLLFIVLEIAILSIEQAHWITPQPSLTLVFILSVLTVWLFVKIRIPGAIKHVLALVIGVIVTIGQTLILMTPPETTSRFSHLLGQGAGTLLPGDDKIPFVVFITFLTWVIGYFSTWFVLRRNNAWVAVSLGAVVLLVNLSNLPDSYYIYFFLYFFAAALLIAVTRMTGRPSKAGHTANYSGRSLLYLGVSLLCITVLAASVSWITPQVRAPALQDLIAAKLPWQSDILDSKLNIFNAVPSKQTLSTASTLKDLPFEKRWNQGDEVNFIVFSERPSYWRMNVYDTYTSQGWVNSPTSKTFLDSNVPWADTERLSNQDMMNYAVTVGIRTDVLLTAGGFVSSDIPVRVNAGAGKDITAVTALRVLDPGERYTVTSYVSLATEGELSRAGKTYPESIKSKYLQLPSNLPDDIKQLSENITGEATTLYAKAMAIVNYLSKFTYTLEVNVPPEGTDSVEYFLFIRKTGFCLHFASAAVLMLRSVDIPSRLAVGYLPGDPGKIAGQYLLRDKSFHAWPQVYFPGYGWVDIEATPSSAESQVFIDTPLVSGSAIENLPQWDVWQGAIPPDIRNMANIDMFNTPGDGTGETVLSFVGKLGHALLFIFTAALIIALLIGLILMMKSISFRWLWRVDRNALAYGTYTNMCELAARVGLAPRPQQTPLEFASGLAAALPQEAKALDGIVQAYVENRFGRREGKLDLFLEAEVLKARIVVYNALLQRLGAMRKLFGKK